MGEIAIRVAVVIGSLAIGVGIGAIIAVAGADYPAAPGKEEG